VSIFVGASSIVFSCGAGGGVFSFTCWVHEATAHADVNKSIVLFIFSFFVAVANFMPKPLTYLSIGLKCGAIPFLLLSSY